MNNGWEPGGLLLNAWAQLTLARAACDPDYLLTHPVMRQALDAAHDALDAARLNAIREESNYLQIATDNLRLQGAGVLHDPNRPG